MTYSVTRHDSHINVLPTEKHGYFKLTLLDFPFIFFQVSITILPSCSSSHNMALLQTEQEYEWYTSTHTQDDIIISLVQCMHSSHHLMLHALNSIFVRTKKKLKRIHIYAKGLLIFYLGKRTKKKKQNKK